MGRSLKGGLQWSLFSEQILMELPLRKSSPCSRFDGTAAEELVFKRLSRRTGFRKSVFVDDSAGDFHGIDNGLHADLVTVPDEIL